MYIQHDTYGSFALMSLSDPSVLIRET